MRTMYSLLFAGLVLSLVQFGCTRSYAADVFQSALSSEVKKIPAKQRSWFTGVLTDDFETAVGSWETVKSQVGQKNMPLGHAAYVYSLYKLGLYQSLVEEMLQANSLWLSSVLSAELQNFLSAQMDRVLTQAGVYIYPDLRKQLLASKLTNKTLRATLLSYAFLSEPAELPKYLPDLPKTNLILRPGVKKSVAFLMNQSKLKEAEEIARLVPGNHLDLARVYFQAGELHKAAEAYDKVSRQEELYPASREELAWTYLRMNDVGGLRGLTNQLTRLDNIADRPESYVLQAISNLKVCNYAAAKQDIQFFTRELTPVARKIDAVSKLSKAPAPARPDVWTQSIQRRLVLLQKEVDVWTELEEEKIVKKLRGYQAVAQNELQSHYKRQWNNEYKMIDEAIVKMRFVKLEYLSQLRRLEQYEERPHLLSQKVLNKETLVADASVSGSLAALKNAESEKMVFRADEALWSDEVYRLRSLTPSECVRFLRETQQAGGRK